MALQSSFFSSVYSAWDVYLCPFICILECIDEKSRPIRELRVSKSYIPAVAGEATIIMISRAANHKAFVSFDTLVLLSKNSALTFSESAQCENSINFLSF